MVIVKCDRKQTVAIFNHIVHQIFVVESAAGRNRKVFPLKLVVNGIAKYSKQIMLQPGWVELKSLR
jgi:hypothetical protein